MKILSPQEDAHISTRKRYPAKFLTLLLLVPPGIVLLLHSYLGSYTRLIADDFCSFYFARRLDILRYSWYWYLNWGGRYSAFAVDSLIENIGPNGLRYFPSTLLVIWVTVTTFAFYAFLKAETGKAPSVRFAFAMGITTVFAILSASPNVPQILYWWNGMRTYLPSLIAATFYVGFLYWAQKNLQTRKAILLGSVVSFVIGLITGGFNEPMSVILFSFFVGFTTLGILSRTLRFHDPMFYVLSAAIAGTTLALLIMLMSPGTEIRQEFYPPAPGIARMLEIALDGYLEYLIWIFRPAKSVSALIALVFTSIWIGTESEKKLSHGYWISTPILSGLLLSFASILPSIYGTSEMAGERTLLVSSFIIVVSLIYTGLMTGRWISGRTADIVPIQSGLMLCAGLSILFSAGVNAKELYESRDTYIRFAQRWDQADAQILQAKQNGEASVTIPTQNPWTGPGGDPTDNPRFWVTTCYSLYYDFPVFGPSPETEPPGK